MKDLIFVYFDEMICPISFTLSMETKGRVWYNIKKDGADHEVPRSKTSSFIHPFACQNRFDASFSAVAVLVCSANQLGGLVYNLDGVLSNIGTFCSNEEVSYLAGWLGDATLIDDGTTYFANDDYCADLDAENIYRLILQEYSFLNAFSAYYCSFNDTVNRATTFLSYISYEYVQNKVFTRLVPGETAPWNIIQSRYPDTYNFLLSLQDTLHEMGDYQ